MKKAFLITILALVATMPCAAQFKFGIKAGIGAAWLSNPKEYSADLSARMGFQAGVFAERKLSNKFNLEVDLLYSLQGGKETIPEYGSEQILTNVKQTTTSHYLNIPVTAKYFPTDRFYIEAGAQVGVLLKSTFSYDNFESQTSVDNNKLDIGIVVGAGYKIDDHWGVGLRYTHGFANTIKYFNGFKNRGVHASVSYSF